MIEQIKEWLRNGRKDHRCPFHHVPGTGLICMDLFPNIIATKEIFMRDRPCGITHECPCTVYGVKEVIAIAEEVVNEI